MRSTGAAGRAQAARPLSGWVPELAIVLALLWAIAPCAHAGSKARELIAAARQATGGAAWDRVEGLHEQGLLTAGNLAGRYESWIDFKGLRETSSFQLGPASEAEGWDGREKWSIDSSKERRVETSQESVAAAIQEAYRKAYGLFFPGRHPAACAYRGHRSVDGNTYEIIRVAPQGADPFEVWLDPATHLIAREVQVSGDEPRAFLFSDWRPVGSIRLPFRTIVRTGGNSKFDRVFTARHVELSGSVSSSRFAPPAVAASPALWPQGESSVTVPFRLINNHVYVPASINGRPPQNMIFDTGATDILELSHAAALGIRSQGALPVGGIGDKMAAYGLARVESVSIGGLTLRDQVFGTLDLRSLLKVEDADTAGLIGYEFARRAVITIDYARRTLTFTRTGGFHPPAGPPPIRFTFHEHAPIVTAALDGVTGQFELDTGARTGLMVMGPFDRSGLWISRAADGTIAIDDVVPGSAAGAAGLRVGDRITAVNGAPAAAVAVYELRQQLKEAPGTRIEFRVKRGARDLSFDLVLANQV